MEVEMDAGLKEFLFGYRPWRRYPEYKKSDKGLTGFQQGGPEFTDQTKLGVIDYLKATMISHFHWSPKAAEDWLQSQAREGGLESHILTETGITLISPNGKIQYEFVKLSEKSWNVVRIEPDIPMPE